MADQQKESQAPATTQTASPLEQIVSQAKWKTPKQRESGVDLIDNLIQFLVNQDPKSLIDKDSERSLKRMIAYIDERLSTQVSAVMHHPSFTKLEGSWRGLHYLVHQSETGDDLKIRVLNVSKKELLKDFDKAAEFDQSTVWKAIYSQEYGTFGGDPYGALIGDYEFDNSPEDVTLLERISNVAAGAHAPFISAASPSMFQLESYEELGRPRSLSKIFETADYAQWRSFRESEDSRYVALTLPRTLARLPYGKKTRSIDAFAFEEGVDGHDDFVWSNAAYAHGARLTDAFAKYGWCAGIAGPEGGGMVEGLPAYTFKDTSGDVALKCPTEIGIDDTREKELSDLGFISLVHKKKTDKAAFFGTQTCRKAKKWNRADAQASEELSTKLNLILCTSRFAHFLKVMARDRINSPMEASECQDWLNNWILDYVLENPQGKGDRLKREKPLAAARIEVSEIKSRPGHYTARAFLRPHFQFESLNADLSLVADLPPAKG